MDPNIPHDQYHHDHYAQQPQQHHSGAITHQSQMQPPNMEHPYPPAPTQLDYTAGPPLHQEYQEQYQPHPSGTMEHHMVPQPTHLAQHVQPIPHPASGHPGVLSQAQPPPVVRRPSLQNIQTQTGQYYTQPHMPYSPMNPSGYPPPTTGSPATYHAPPGPPHEYATPYGSTQQHAMSPYPAMTPPAANQPYHPAITDGAGHAHTAPGHGGDRSAPVSTPATPSMMHPHAPPQPVRNMSYEHLQHHQQPPVPAQHHVQHPHPGHEHQNVYQHPPPPVSDVQGPYAPAVHQHPHGHLQHAPSYSPNYVQPGTNGHAAPSAPVYESARPPPPPNVESTAPGLPSAPGGLYIETHPQAPQQPIPITPMAPLQTQQQQQQLDLRMSMSATPSPISPATPSEGGHGRPPRSSASSVHSESTESLHSAVSSVSTNAYGPTTPITPSSRGTKGHARRGGRESSTSVTSAAGTGGASGGRHDGGRPTSRASRGSGADDDESDPESELLRAVNADTAEQRKEEARQQRMNAEQRRRDQLRDGYDRLQAVIPHAKDKLSKVKLIECATQFIVDLTKRQEATQSRYEQLIKERDDLLRKNEELGSSLNGPSPSITSTFVTTEDGGHAAAAALASHPASSSDAQASSHVALPPTPLSIPPSGPSSGQPSSSSGPSSRSPVTGTGPPRRTRAQGAGVYAAAPRRDPTSTEAGSSNGHAEHDAEMSDGAS